MDASTAGTFVREDSGFDSGGVRCAAWVYRPAGVPGVGDGAARPVVVMAHGFGGDRRVRLTAFAERFAAAGHLVVLFDYRTFGDSQGAPRRVLRIRAQHDDYRAAVAFARSLPGRCPAPTRPASSSGGRPCPAGTCWPSRPGIRRSRPSSPRCRTCPGRRAR